MKYEGTDGNEHYYRTFPKSRYLHSDITYGPQLTPSQQQDRVGISDIPKLWFKLTEAQKQLWRIAARSLLWQDTVVQPDPHGQAYTNRKRRPTGRELFNRMNRARHSICSSARFPIIPYTGTTALEPPSDPVVMPELGTVSVTMKARTHVQSGEHPDWPPDPRGVTKWFWARRYAEDEHSAGTTYDPPYLSDLHNCGPIASTKATPIEGVQIEGRDLQWYRDHFLNFDASDIYPDGPGTTPQKKTTVLWSGQHTNDIPHYDPTGGQFLITFAARAGVNVYLEIYSEKSEFQPPSTKPYWRFMGSLPAGIQCNNGLCMPSGDKASPTDWNPDETWFDTDPEPNDGRDDIRSALAYFGRMPDAGHTYRFRAFPFDNDGWPGSKIEFTATVQAAPLYDTLPNCPNTLPPSYEGKFWP